MSTAAPAEMTEERTATAADATRAAGGDAERGVGYVPDEDELLEREAPEMAQLLAEVRSGTLAYEPGSGEGERLPLLPAIGLGIGAFAVVGLFVWLSGRVMNAANGMQNQLTRGSAREIRYQEDDPPGGLSRGTPTMVAAPGLPGVSAFGGSNPVAPPPPAPVSPVNVGKGPFLGEAERSFARAALQPLKELVKLVQKYDGEALTRATVAPKAPGRVVLVDTSSLPANDTGSLPPVTLNPSDIANIGDRYNGADPGPGAILLPAAPAAPTSTVDAERVQMETQGIAAQLDLISHDEQYPAPLRPAVREVRKELHGYLVNTQLAAGSDRERERYRSAAGKRLSRAQAILGYLDGVVSGGTDPNETPIP